MGRVLRSQSKKDTGEAQIETPSIKSRGNSKDTNSPVEAASRKRTALADQTNSISVTESVSKKSVVKTRNNKKEKKVPSKDPADVSSRKKDLPITRGNSLSTLESENTDGTNKEQKSSRQESTDTTSSRKRAVLGDQTNSPESATKNKAKSTNTIKNYFKPADKNDEHSFVKPPRKSILKEAANSAAEPKRHVPVYKATKMSLPQNLPPEQLVHLYDFEVDENEPKVKKMKKKRTVKPRKTTQARRKPAAPLKALNTNLNPMCEKSVSQAKPNKFSPIEPDIIDCDSNSYEMSFGSKQMAACSTPFHAGDELPISSIFGRAEPELDTTVKSAEPAERRLSTSFSLAPNLTKTPAKTETPARGDIPVLFNDSAAEFTREESERIEASGFDADTHCSPPEMPTSTPVKFNSMCSVTTAHSNTPLPDMSHLDTTNFFGFDEPDSVEEPLLSPIKGPAIEEEEKKRDLAADPHRPKEVVPVQQIIRMLRFGDEATTTTTRVDIDKSDEEELPIKEMNFFDDNTTPEVKENFRLRPRRSYERPFKPKRHSDTEDSSEEEERKTVVKPQLPKKKNVLSKKEQKDFTDWVKSFNSQCKQVDEFELCIE